MSFEPNAAALPECWVSATEQSCAPVSGSRPHYRPVLTTSRPSPDCCRDFRPSSMHPPSSAASLGRRFPAAAGRARRALALPWIHRPTMTDRRRSWMHSRPRPPNEHLSAASAACAETAEAVHDFLSFTTDHKCNSCTITISRTQKRQNLRPETHRLKTSQTRATLLSTHADRQGVDCGYIVCCLFVCNFVRLRISPARVVFFKTYQNLPHLPRHAPTFLTWNNLCDLVTCSLCRCAYDVHAQL